LSGATMGQILSWRFDNGPAHFRNRELSLKSRADVR
jgi:hypothetical protein